MKLVSVDGNDAELLVDGKRVIVPFLRSGDEIQFVWRGETFTAEVSSRPRPRKRGGEHSMSAPMPGTVLKIFVEPGDVVAKGDPLLILEAMKMEHQILAPYAGTVEALHCSSGELVQPGAADRDALGAQEASDGGDGEAAPLHRRGQRDVEGLFTGSRKRRPWLGHGRQGHGGRHYAPHPGD